MKRGGADFSGLCTPLGEEGARKVAHRLAGLSLPPEQYAELRRRQTAEVVADLRPVDEIRFAPMPNVNPESIRPIMDTEAGKPIDQTVLDRDIRRIYGTGNFEHVKYRFLEEPGRRVLVVDAVEKTWGFDALRFGLGLSCDFKGDAFFNLIGSYRKYWLNSPGGEWRTDVQVGRSNAVSTELYQPLTARGTFFVAPNASWSRRTTDVYQQNDRVATYDISELTAGLSAGDLLGRYGEVRLGVEGARLRSALDTGPSFLSPGESRITQGAATLRLLLDRIDSVHFPPPWLARQSKRVQIVIAAGRGCPLYEMRCRRHRCLFVGRA